MHGIYFHYGVPSLKLSHVYPQTSRNYIISLFSRGLFIIAGIWEKRERGENTFSRLFSLIKVSPIGRFPNPPFFPRGRKGGLLFLCSRLTPQGPASSIGAAIGEGCNRRLWSECYEEGIEMYFHSRETIIAFTFNYVHNFILSLIFNGWDFGLF